MRKLRQVLLGKPELETPNAAELPALRVSIREIEGTWLYERNENATKEAIQALCLDADGQWRQLESGLNGIAPGAVIETGEWWIRDGTLNRLSEAHERHKDRGRQLQARIIFFNHEELWLYGEFEKGAPQRVLRFRRSSPEQFIAMGRHIQNENRQIKVISLVVFSALTIGLFTLITFLRNS